MGSIELKLTKTEVRTKVVNVKLMESIQATLKMEMRMKVMDLELGSKVICSGHAHAIAAMHHIVRVTPFCKLD